MNDGSSALAHPRTAAMGRRSSEGELNHPSMFAHVFETGCLSSTWDRGDQAVGFFYSPSLSL